MAVKIPDSIISVGAFTASVSVLYIFSLRLLLVSVSEPAAAGVEEMTFFVMQALVIAALIGSLSAYRRHRKVLPPLIATASAAAIIYGMNVGPDVRYMFPGMIGLLVVSLWNAAEHRRPPSE